MTQKCGFVALVGAPNAGKSTLLNALVGTKVSIVSRKAQTTRFQIRGLLQKDQTQIVFVDTPGIFEPKRRLDRAMVHSAWSGAGDADIIALLIDSVRGFDEQNEEIVQKLKERTTKKIVILNKIDLLPRDELLMLATQAQEKIKPDAIFMVSALKADGLASIANYLAAQLPDGPWLYPDDQFSDLSQRMLAAEITREVLFDRLHDELPYSLTVETEKWEEKKDGSIRIEQVIYIERSGQKKILLGRNGEMIKAISISARHEMQTVFETKIHLFLFVKQREGWGDDPERYSVMGLEFPH